LRIQALVAHRTRPSLSARVQIVRLGDQDVIAVEVPHARSPVGTTDGKYLRRALGGDGKPACLPLHFHEMQGLQGDRGLLDDSARAIPDAGWDDLDPLEFERFRRFVREGQGRGDVSLLDLPDVELAKAMGAIQADHAVLSVRALGLLLFGREESLRRLLPVHEVAFQVLNGLEVWVNDFLRWPLLRVMDELLARFRSLNREMELLVGMLRVAVPDYSPAAFREGVANALIHRDYTRRGAVHVQWHDDRVEMSNPGGFPDGLRLDNLLVTQPRPRNPLLADAFKRAGVVERTARGIDTIFLEQLRNGRAVPSYARSNETGVTLVLPGGKANLDFARLEAEESQAQRALGLDDLLLLNQLRVDRRLRTVEAARLIQKPETEARSRLQRLVEAELAEARGEGNRRSWHLSAATCRRLGEKAWSMRQRALDLVQQEQLVFQYVAEHGSIGRSEVAKHCRLSPPQAYRLLKRLERLGKLRQISGSTKGVRYGSALK